jgi:hypothetical protein
MDQRRAGGLPATLQRVRVDRHLDEAVISGAGPLHLAEVVGMCESTAIRCADAVRRLLDPTRRRPCRRQAWTPNRRPPAPGLDVDPPPPLPLP